MKIKYLAIITIIATLAALFTGSLFVVGNHNTIVPTMQHVFTPPLMRTIFIACLLACLMSICATIGLACYIARMLTRPKKQDQFIPLTPDVLGLPAEAVSFPCQGDTYLVRGLYIPHPDATSTLLICPGYRRSLADVLITCKHMWEAGHNILAFEYYGHGLPVGSIVTLGYREVNDFLGAVAYATLRAPDTRLGAIGYSMGAATSIMACARTKKVEALVADSSFATQWSAVQVAIKNTLRVSLPHWFMRILYHATDLFVWLHAGYHFHQVEPVREISEIAPRPLLLIHGLRDKVVNPLDAVQLYEAAAEPKSLWLIPQSEHIRGYFVDATTYTARLVTFFAHLKQRPAPKTSPLPIFARQPFSTPATIAPSHASSSYRHKIELIEEDDTNPSFAPEHAITASLPRLWEHELPPLTQGEAYHAAIGMQTQPLARTTEQLSLRGELHQRRLTRSLQLRYARTRTNTIIRRQTNQRLHQLGVAYGSLIHRYRWLMLTVWIVILGISAPFASALPNILHNSGYEINGSESNRVDSVLNNTLHQPVSQLLVVFQSQSLAVSTPRYQQEVHTFVTRVHTFPSVTSATQGNIGRDGRTTFVTVGFNVDQDAVAQHLTALRALLPNGANAPAHATITGDAAITNEIQIDTQTDTEHAEMIALPLTLLVLLLVFGTVVAGLMPLALAAVTVPVTLAIIYAVAMRVETNIFVLNVASIIGLGLSIDYSLFIIRRFREELAQGQSVPAALGLTVATAGESVLFSGLTVIVGFSGLFFVGIPVMSSFALGGITVAATAVIAALTLLPALLGIVGTRINALRMPFSHFARSHKAHMVSQAKHTSAKRQGFWHTWAMIVMRRPVLMIVLVTVTLVALGWPALSLHPDLPGASALPSSSEARQALDTLTAQFPNVNVDPIIVVAQTPDDSSILTEHNLLTLQSLSQRIKTLPHVAAVSDLVAPPNGSPLLTLSAQQRLLLYISGTYQHSPQLAQQVAATTRHDITLIAVQADSDENGQTLINDLRALNQRPGLGLHMLVGGSQAITLDFDTVLYGNFIRALAFILIATYVLLLVMFRSIVLPLKAIIMNILSIGAAYGALVFVFQQGHLQNMLAFSSDGSIDRFIPVLLFCVLFGLSMDYEVFLLSRIQEEWRNSGENSPAVAHGVERTGGIITSAALLFVIVSASFITTSLVVTKELGLGITIAVLVDASIIRSVLVPATMQVMGRWNWWFPGKRHEPQRITVQVQEVPVRLKVRSKLPAAISSEEDLSSTLVTPHLTRSRESIPLF